MSLTPDVPGIIKVDAEAPVEAEFPPTDNQEVKIDEQVFLSKFDGEALPENEVERLSVHNGVVLSHQVIENGEPVGEVTDGNMTGQDLGRFAS